MAQRNFQDRPRRENELSAWADRVITPTVGNQATLRDGEVDGPRRPPTMRNQMCPLYPYLFEMTPHFEVTGSRGEGQAKESPDGDTNIPRNRPTSPDRKGHITPPAVSSQYVIDKLEILSESFSPYYDEELRSAKVTSCENHECHFLHSRLFQANTTSIDPRPDDGMNTEMPLPVSGEINASISSQPRSYHRPPKVNSMMTEEMQRQIDIRSLRPPSGREWEDPLERYMNSKILEAAYSPSLPILDPPIAPSSLAEQIKQRERSLREAEARSEKEINECLGLFSSSSHKTQAPATVGGPNVYGILNAMSKEPVPPQALGCQTVPANFNPHLATLGAGDIFGLFTEASPCKHYFSSSQPPMPSQAHAKKFPPSDMNQRSGALAKDANARMAPPPMWRMRDGASGHKSKPVQKQNTSSEPQATAEPEPMNEDAEFSDVMLVDDGDQPSNAREEDEDWLVV